MGEVIGYKGTPEQRLLDWNTLLLIRSSMKFSQQTSNLWCLDKERRWHKDELSKYVA